MGLRARSGSNPIAVVPVEHASLPGSSSGRGALLGFRTSTSEATPKVHRHQGEDRTEHRTGQLQPDELSERQVDASRAGEGILEWLEQQANELRPLRACSGEPQDDADARPQQRTSMIDLRNFFRHAVSIRALPVCVYRIPPRAERWSPGCLTRRALAVTKGRSHTRRQ